MKKWIPFGLGLFLLTQMNDVFASAASSGSIGMVNTTLGVVALIIFGVAYLAVRAEDVIHRRTPKPVILTPGLIGLINAFRVNGV